MVLRDDLKPAARERFRTPLVFSVQEAKGLEYESVILFELVSSERRNFEAIAAGLAEADVAAGELKYARAADKADKSLDTYKFFINAFYVAATRAVKNLYVVESDTAHPMLRLLGLATARDRLELAEQRSSIEEWQQEAHRLESQGKLEQAEDVRRERAPAAGGAVAGARRGGGRRARGPGARSGERLEQAAPAPLRVRGLQRRAGVGGAAGDSCGSSPRAACSP